MKTSLPIDTVYYKIVVSGDKYHCSGIMKYKYTLKSTDTEQDSSMLTLLPLEQFKATVEIPGYTPTPARIPTFELKIIEKLVQEPDPNQQFSILEIGNFGAYKTIYALNPDICVREMKDVLYEILVNVSDALEHIEMLIKEESDTKTIF